MRGLACGAMFFQVSVMGSNISGGFTRVDGVMHCEEVPLPELVARFEVIAPTLAGHDGNDVLHGYAGNDRLDGGSGGVVARHTP